jgi:site-specific DNA recombinase
VPHQAEQKVIQKIMSLKSKGHSFREIARLLTESGIPSKRGGQWSKTTVQEIYKREQEKKK